MPWYLHLILYVSVFMLGAHFGRWEERFSVIGRILKRFRKETVEYDPGLDEEAMYSAWLARAEAGYDEPEPPKPTRKV